jgi:thiol-disulfide isomerase/thioredoxin
MKAVVPFLLMTLLLSCNTSSKNYNEEIEVYESFDQLQSLLDAEPETVWVVNFWATTCPPCLKEMPHFAELEKQYINEKVKVLLVSLDDKKNLESRVIPFVEKRNITPEVLLLADQNYSAWTDEIDPSWFGALPATIILKGDQRNFRFGAYESYEELMNDVNKMKQ